MTFIGSKAFYDCQKVTSVSLTPGLTTLGDGSDGYTIFFNNIALTSITIPSTITYEIINYMKILLYSNKRNIGTFVFQWCSGISKIVFVNGLTVIGEGMFDMAILDEPSPSALQSVTIPSTITYLGELFNN